LSPLPTAASMVVLHQTAVLMVKRAKSPNLGLWSLPGGRIEPGEAPEHAALREVSEETGITVEIAGQMGNHTVAIASPASKTPIVIAVFYGGPATGQAVEKPTPTAGDDASDARWTQIADLKNYPLTEGAHELILAAALLFAQNQPQTHD
jgi:8-oxo-dGTP diphosphatase